MDYLTYHNETENHRERRTGVQPQPTYLPLPTRVVMAMWKETYLKRAADLYRALSRAYGPARVANWSADRVGRDELVRRLAGGPVPLAFYLGHGRPRGWSGYRGLRYHHLEAVPTGERPAVGALISLSCSTLEFGRQLVDGGRAGAFLGAAAPLRIPTLLRLLAEFGAVYGAEGPPPATIRDLISRMDRRVAASAHPELAALWEQFELLGNPDQPI
ncbi:hypothetical protein [Lewinella sp. IMCC34191]|uniref:hypothetical protein n=1 Tax=Lewinella sp. IMCC34191 TaxID=2259172 RepID=UPI000E224958|nr:hypothetical protein [Lewinella sp. IMCC34191]